MKWFAWLVMVAAAVPVLAAENPADTRDAAEVQQLQRQLRQRWNERVRHDLHLSDEQTAKLQETEGKYQQQRRDLAQHQQAVNEALRGQLQPGVAANGDSVRRLMDAREHNRTALAQLDRDEDREIAGYLNPVQHARYQMMREQLRRRIQDIREQRRARAHGPGPRRGAGRPAPADRESVREGKKVELGG